MGELITDANFNEKTGKGNVVVDFYADWCGPCQMLKPEKASSQFKDVHFYKIDVDANEDVPARYGVRSIPTIVFLKDGKEVDRAIGYMNDEQMKAKITGAYK